MVKDELEFSLGSHGDAKVRGWDGLIKWVEREHAHWEWLVPGDGKTDAHGVAGTVQGGWNQLLNNLRAVQSQGQPLEAAVGYLNPLSSGPLLVHDQPDGALVLDIRSFAGDASAAFAYGFLKGMVNLTNVRNRDDLRGAMLVSVPNIQDAAELSARLQKERVNYRDAIKNAIARIDAAADERDAAFRETLTKAKVIVGRMVRRRRDTWKSHQDAWQAAANESVDSIRAVEKAYLEAMRLQAPVKYWEEKSTDHERREFWAIIRLALFFPAALASLGFAFWRSAVYLLEHASDPKAPTPVALYVIITGGLAVVSTLLFWIGRLLTKLYLSEHHLKNDADERAVMTQTYLALTKESAAADADRSIILGALFRNTPDGIVKDDGPSDLSLQAIVSKLATR